MQKLWYKTAPKEWMEGLPVGNGRLAAFVWGDDKTDRIGLNHERLWRGTNRDRRCPESAGHLQSVRDCLMRGDFFTATTLANLYFGGKGGVSGIKDRVDPYQPAGDLVFTPDGGAALTHRELDIENGVCAVERGALQSFFIAHVAEKCIICHWNAGGASFSGRLNYSRKTDPDAIETCEYKDTTIRYACRFPEGVGFKTLVDIVTDGAVIPRADRFDIKNASYMTAFIDIAIEPEKPCLKPSSRGWETLLNSHKNAFSAVMNRVTLDIDAPVNGLPTDERLNALRSGGEDPLLPLLYFHYGRYLLISSSHGGELPANLQGKWNDDLEPPWDSDYHYDINLQMNYWPAEPAGLPECADALLKFVERSVPGAREAAQRLYGCRGVWLPIQTDIWDRPTPEAFGWAAWIGAAPWIAQHFWQRYLYSGDLNFLRGRAYPFFKEVALFYEDYLVKDDAGVYRIMPSQSPENRFLGTGFWPVSIGVSAAMDVQLAYDALGYAVKSAEILNIDADEKLKWETMREHLPPFGVGADGRLLEWDVESAEIEPGHRHVSHLYGLYPSDLFNPVDRPEQFTAAVNALNYRLSQGGGYTGWSRAWTACLFARIGDPGRAWEHFNALLTDFATVSLLDLHPPRIFQIDGNLGAAAAVFEMLVQTWGSKTHLLRALPDCWRSGRLTGVKLPGGHTLDMSWRGGVLLRLTVKIGYAGTLTLAGLADGDDLIITGEPGTTCEIALG